MGGYTKEQMTQIFDKNITLSEFGSFSEQVTLPSDIKPGYYSIAYKRDGDKYPIAYTSFQIAEFRRVTFAVQTKIPKITWYAGDKISQIVLLPIITPELVVVDVLDESDRGDNGFGSSGK